MHFSPVLKEFIDALLCLPGVGPKSAQRMAFHLLSRHRDKGKLLAKQLTIAMEKLTHCESCRIFTENAVCDICLSPRRDPTLLCVVENPIDVMVLEQTGLFKGKYFVLLGRLSPLDGIGPQEIGMGQLKARLLQKKITEIILATNTTIEGEATAHYIAELAKSCQIKTTRIARGIAIGSELEYIDPTTLMHALKGREEII